MPRLIVVLDSRRVTRVLGVDELELPRGRRELQGWLDARAWVLEADVLRELGTRRVDEAALVRSVAWEICGPTAHADASTHCILPGEAQLFDDCGRWRLRRGRGAHRSTVGLSETLPLPAQPSTSQAVFLRR